MAELLNMAELNSETDIDLANTQISDLTPLANLKSLKWLHLDDTQSSEEQITKLQQALPNCAIER